jgi:putative membrane protein
MEPFCNWQSGMWIFPIIGCVVMMLLCIFMMIFSRRSFFGSCFRPWDYDRYTKENNSSESALEILNRRYANGEITKEEYERIKNDILRK